MKIHINNFHIYNSFILLFNSPNFNTLRILHIEGIMIVLQVLGITDIITRVMIGWFAGTGYVSKDKIYLV